MSRIRLIQTPFLRIEHDARKFLYANWVGYVNVPQAKEGCELILKAMKQKKCTLLINDNRELTGSWTQSIPWIANDFLPRFIQGGLEKVAFIYSLDRSARYSVDRLLELNDQYMAQTFENYEAAEAWILREDDHHHARLPDNGRMLTIRNRESHFLIDVYDIYYLSSRHGETVIHTKSGTFTSNNTLKDLARRLPPATFQRIHRSHIINIHEIANLKYHAGGSYRVFLRDLPKIHFPVSRSYAAGLKQRLGLSSQI